MGRIDYPVRSLANIIITQNIKMETAGSERYQNLFYEDKRSF